MSDIALTASQRTSLISLQNTQELSSRTQTRLSTGRKVNNVVDDAVNFFKAKSLSDRASDFDLKKTEIDQGISALNTALSTVESVDSLVKQLKGITSAAVSQSEAERVQSTSSFAEIGKQISELVQDASYQGLNLLTSTTSTLTVSFGIRANSQLQISGVDLNSTSGNSAALFSLAAYSTGGTFFQNVLIGGTGFSAAFSSNKATSQAARVNAILDSSISRLRGQASTLGSNVAVLQTRLDFTNSYVNELNVGSDKLTLADLNEEGANLVALQTRQQLGIQALSVSGQQQQAVLSLIG